MPNGDEVVVNTRFSVDGEAYYGGLEKYEYDGIDKPYVSEIRDIVRQSGFDKVALFQCDWASNFTRNGLDDLIWTMNCHGEAGNP